jgi:dipeptidyl aminopeptidase/acylaminoacyl peptidase
MPLQPGSKVGAYDIVAVLGAGGMGEVYRARDARLSRDVAIKIISARYEADREGLLRFEQEARALAALNHPNLLAIYDIGSQDGMAYIVSELLEGETLRKRLMQGPLPRHRALECATQIVRALVAAHEKGIVHRDLKPDNVFLTKDGHVKLLDFGLAKLVHQPEAAGDGHTGGTTITLDSGAALGTPGYMSPEQLRAQAVDYRSDIFSFGAVLYEMLCGQRVFRGETQADVVSATLTIEPEDLSEVSPGIPPATALIVRHCLEKRPEDRFQSARDLLFDLGSLASSSGSGNTAAQQAARERKSKLRRLWWAAGGAACVAAILLGIRLLTPAAPALPSFTQVTFRRSSIWYARFAGAGDTVLYNASWADRPLDIFSTQLGSTEARSLGISNADLLSVSPTGDLAVLIDRQGSVPWFDRGTLARVPMGGGSPREILEDVQSADWSSDGTSLAVVHQVNGEQRLEYPIGKVLVRSQGWLTDVRVSPNGDRVAFMEHATRWDDRGWISSVDLSGNKQRLTEEFASERGVAWSPDGRQIWFTATRSGGLSALYEVSLHGELRLRYRAPVDLQLHDIAGNGSVLLSTYKNFTTIIGLPPGQSTERDLSWLDDVYLFDLSADGKTFLFQYYGQGSGANYRSYLAKMDGSSPVRLGEGAGVALSPDGKWVITILYQTHQTVLQPTGVGQVRALNRAGIIDEGENEFTPDSRHVLFTGKEPGHDSRCYIQDIDGGKPQPLCPEGITRARMSPDGKWLVAKEGRSYVLLKSDGTDRRPVVGIGPEEEIVRWSGDSQAVFVFRARRPFELFRVDPFTGRRRLLHQVNAPDPASIVRLPNLYVSADGKSYVYHIARKMSELFVVKGLVP